MKKILFVITKSNWGGAQRYVFDLATHLPKEEFAVSVALGGTGQTGSSAGELAARLEAAHISIFYISAFARDVSFMSDMRACRELYRLFKKEKPDVVHLNSSKAGGVGAFAARMAGVKKIIFTVHGLPWDENRSMIAKRLIELFSRLTFLLCTKIILISKDNFERVGGKKTVLIYNGIDQSIQFESGEKIRSAFPEGVKITGTVGELTRNKNQITLIEEVRNKLDMYVAIVGEGEERKNLEEKIREYKLEDRVKLFGFLPAREVMKGFDTFALPSLKEGLPYVLLEARAAGLPIRANRVGGVGEILDAKDMNRFSIEQMVEETKKLY